MFLTNIEIIKKWFADKKEMEIYILHTNIHIWIGLQWIFSGSDRCSKSLCWHVCLNLNPSQLNTDKKIQCSSLDLLLRYDALGFIFGPCLATHWKMNIPLSVCCVVQRRCWVRSHQSCLTLEEEEEEEQNILLQHPQQTTERVSYLMKSKSSSFPVCCAWWSDRSSANDQSSTQV